MTTAGSNGAPEDAAAEDPFAYLYRPAEGEAAPSQPRTSYARPMEVGRAQYGQQPQQPYRPQPPHAQPSHAQATTQLPQQQARYAERSRPQPGEERPAGRGKATVIGAVAVVAAIAIGAGVALSMGDGGKQDNKATGHSSAPAVPSTAASASSSGSASASASSDPVADSSKLQAQGAASGNSVKGAVSADGGYLTLQAGSSVTWTVSAPAAGQYKFWLHYNNSGTDVPATVAINGKDRDGGVNLKDYKAGTAPEQSWWNTNIWPELQAGTNTITVSLPAGSSGSVLIDQLALTPMSVSSYPTK